MSETSSQVSTPPSGAAPPEAPEAPEAPETGYRAAFLEILNGSARRHGFMVVAQETQSLQSLQGLCVDPEQEKTCLTARYRLGTGPVLGTLFAAFATDLQRLFRQDTRAKTDRPSPVAADDLLGDVLPPPAPDPLSTPWRLLQEPVQNLWSQIQPSEVGRWSLVEPEPTEVVRWWWEVLLTTLDVLPSDYRLVLFVEVADDPGDLEQLARAAGEVLDKLPKRVGVVFGGLPDRFTGPKDVPPDDPHLLLSHVPEAEGVGHPSRYVDAALSGDKAAERDSLRVGDYADALARLVLLPETRPLTIGIHAPWGKGKSSFMAFVQQRLVSHAPANKVNKLSNQLREFDDKLVKVEQDSLKDAGEFRELGGPERRAAEERRLAELEAERERLEGERRALLQEMQRAAEPDVITVDFNAWRFENAAQIWAGLAREITLRFEAALPRRSRIWSRIAYAVAKRPADFWVGLVTPALVALFVGLLLFLLGLGRLSDQIDQQLPDWAHWLVAVVPAGSIVFTLLFVMSRLFKVVQPVSARILDYVRRPDYREEMGYQNWVIDDLTFLRKRVVRAKARGRRRPAAATVGQPRVVVFIDDLDRCSDEHVMEILQAINLILGASDYFVFLGIDTDMIYRAIEKHYGLDDPENDGQGETFAENYLRKIIQLSFHLPETSPEQRFTFVEQMFSVQARKEMLERQKREHKGRDGAEPSQPPPPSPPPPHADGDPFNVNLSAVVSPRIELPRDVKDTGTELETFNSFKDFIRDNPRELKRIVNVHRLVKILLVRKEAPLSEPAQAQLVAWLVFCTRWPVLVDDALRKSAERLGEAPDDDVLGLLSGGSDLGDDAAALQRFRGVLVEQELELPVRDLRTGGLLSEAARISQMVRDRPAPRLSPAVGASSRVGRLDGEPPARADGPSALGPDGADDG